MAADNQPFQIALQEDGTLMMGQGLNVLPLICNGCGYVRLHAVGAL